MRAMTLALALIAAAGSAGAQFVGPTASGQTMTVAAAAAARPDTYVTVTGVITSHLREDYYLFRDETGEIRVEIAPGVFGGRQIGPDTRLRLLGEVDRTAAGVAYLWIKRLDVL